MSSYYRGSSEFLSKRIIKLPRREYLLVQHWGLKFKAAPSSAWPAASKCLFSKKDLFTAVDLVVNRIPGLPSTVISRFLPL